MTPVELIGALTCVEYYMDKTDVLKKVKGLFEVCTYAMARFLEGCLYYTPVRCSSAGLIPQLRKKASVSGSTTSRVTLSPPALMANTTSECRFLPTASAFTWRETERPRLGSLRSLIPPLFSTPGSTHQEKLEEEASKRNEDGGEIKKMECRRSEATVGYRRGRWGEVDPRLDRLYVSLSGKSTSTKHALMLSCSKERMGILSGI